MTFKTRYEAGAQPTGPRRCFRLSFDARESKKTPKIWRNRKTG
jgi:hypothetical protein